MTFVFFSCGKRDENVPLDESDRIQPAPAVEKPIDTAQNKEIKTASLKLYVENTASMNGYIEGFTGFKEVLARLINEVEVLDTPNYSTHLYLINNKITELNIPNRITTDLNKDVAFGKGDRGNSDFEKVISKILEEHHKDDISVLAADFIYSPKDGSTRQRLEEFQEFTKQAFLNSDIKKKNLEVLFLRFNSDFNDKYYDINNNEITGIKKRPYYLMILANQQLMTEFRNKVNPKLISRSDFENSVYFDSKSTNEYPLDDYSILTSTLNSAPLKANKIEGKKIKSVSAPRDEKLQMAIALNLSKIPVSENYKLNISNYKLENYEIKKIGEIENNQIIFSDSENPITIMGSDKDKLEDLTHVFLITSAENNIEELKFNIKKQVPSWVNESSIIDDRDITENSIKQKQTFGLKYFINGIHDAYKRNNNNYYSSLSVSIVPVSEGSGLGSLLFVGLLIVIVIGIIMIIKNKKQRQ